MKIIAHPLTTETAYRCYPVGSPLKPCWEAKFAVAHVEDDASVPDGWLAYETVNDKPSLAPGETLAYDCEVAVGTLRKTYLAVRVPTRYSKLSIYGALSALGRWEDFQRWLEAKTFGGLNGWLAFSLAQEISDAHPMFSVLSDEARRTLGLSEGEFAALLGACVLEDQA